MTHPYKDAPAYRRWTRSIAQVAPEEVDPVVCAKFQITRDDKVATAGSCFAQHIARRLAATGFSYLVTEQVHPLGEHLKTAFNYGTYTARYGNIYTTRQLIQLLHRAYGLWTPSDDHWPMPDGSVVDPYRPEIQPGGFVSVEELHADRVQHFAAVRRAVEEADVFVFTLGLTEVWLNEDGAAYPLAPGVSGGTFDPDRHRFLNMDVDEVVADLQAAIAFMREHNPSIRFILTVSPVPLMATAEDRSVLVSTIYSKSVLRVAADKVARQDGVAYFPSYEIITGNYGQDYFGANRRDVRDEGVSHVMRLFLKHYAGQEGEPVPTPAAGRRLDIVEQITKAVCEEEALDRA